MYVCLYCMYVYTLCAMFKFLLIIEGEKGKEREEHQFVVSLIYAFIG